MKHNNDFRHDLEVGQKGEKLLEDMIEGDKIEVKSEQTKMSKNWMTTGNCFVEYESRDKISGLAHTESKWWAINFMDGDELCFSAFLPVDRMKKIGRKFYKEKDMCKVVITTHLKEYWFLYRPYLTPKVI